MKTSSPVSILYSLDENVSKLLLSLFDSDKEECFLLIYLCFFFCLFLFVAMPEVLCLFHFLFFDLFSSAVLLSLPLWSKETSLCLPSPLWPEGSKFLSKVCSELILLASSSMRCCGVVVITTAQLNSTKSELRFCAGSNSARGLSEISDGESLRQWSRLEITQKRLSSVNQSAKTVHHLHHYH